MRWPAHICIICIALGDVFPSRAEEAVVPPTRDVVLEQLRQMTRGDADAARTASEAVRAYGASAVPALRELLASGEPRIRQVAFLHLVWAQEDPLAFIRKTLAHPDEPDLRIYALGALGQADPGSTNAVEFLVECLGDADGCVRLHAATYLALMHERASSALPVLIEALHDADRTPPCSVPELLAKQYAKMADDLQSRLPNADLNIEEIQAAYLADISVDMRSRLMTALVMIAPGDERVAAELFEQMGSTNERVSSVARANLWHMGRSAAPFLLERLKRGDERARTRALEVLGMIEDEETKEQMVSILQGLVSEWCGGPDGGSRVAEALMSTSRVTFAERAVYALCAADPKAATPAVPYLVATLGTTNEFADSPSPAYLLAQIGSNAVPALVESLASTNDVVCEHAVRALAWIESDARYAAIPALVECLGREEPDVYMSAGAALRRFGAAAIPPLVEALESTNTSTVTHALMILAKADEPLDSDAMQAVARLLRHSNFSVRYSAAHALSRFGAAAVPVLTELLEDDVLAVRVMAAEALGELGPDAHAAVAALEELAKSDQRAVAQSAQAALSKISGAPPTRP